LLLPTATQKLGFNGLSKSLDEKMMAGCQDIATPMPAPPAINWVLAVLYTHNFLL
jgi:hypothetical protein